jgi:hypothetical protein
LKVTINIVGDHFHKNGSRKNGNGDRKKKLLSNRNKFHYLCTRKDQPERGGFPLLDRSCRRERFWA